MSPRNYQSQSLLEALEPRQLLAASPLIVTTAWINGGNQLQITGSKRADYINVAPAAGGLTVSNGSWATTVAGLFTSIVVRAGKANDVVVVDPTITTPVSLFGGLGDDTLTGGAGDDHLYGQGGADVLIGGAGDDVLVNIGDSRADIATGGAGLDSFWTGTGKGEQITDASADELASGTVHRVASFRGFSTMRRGVPRANRISLDLNGGDLADPAVDDGAVYANFASDPLFSSSGPSADDVDQGYIGDCWFLASLAATARTNPNAIRQAVVELGDGTYAVQFANPDGSMAYVRVDGDLPTASWGGLEYAGLGDQNSLWVAIMEKAYATFRDGGPASYAALDGGWMDEAFSDLGFENNAVWDASNGD